MFLAFLKRDFRLEVSYRFNLILQIFGGLIFLLIFYFISESLTFKNPDLLEKYGDNYFLFSSLGIVTINLVMVSLLSSSSAFREAQMLGYLDNLLSYRLTVIELFFYNLSYPLLKAIFIGLIQLLFIGYMSNQYLSLMEIFDFIFISYLILISFLGLGMISSAFILYFKVGNPINLLVGFISSLFSGIFYPIESLPNFGMVIAKAIPLTYGIDCLRERIMHGSKYADISDSLIILLVLSAVYFIVGYAAITLVSNLSRKDGSISNY